MTDKLCILVCENFRREAAVVIESEGLEDVVVAPFPATCGRPKIRWGDLDDVIRSHGHESSRICLMGGTCIAGLEDPPKGPDHCKTYRTDQCFYMLLNKDIIHNYIEKGAYLLTPGWLAQWREHVADWDFDQKTSREFFGEFASRLILLDTGVYGKNASHFQEFADFVALPHEIVPVGLDLFRMFLVNSISDWRLDREKNESEIALANVNRQLADYAMVSDLAGMLAEIGTEDRVIKNIFELFSMICAPSRLIYVPFKDGKPGRIQTHPASLVVNVRAYQKIRETLDALERSNRDLEQFAYVASHDLKEPLQKVQAFGDLLMSGYNEMLDEKGRDFLKRMQDAARRMGHLIDDLLTLSRVSTRARPFDKVNLSKTAQEVVADLETQIERLGGRVELYDLPIIEAAPLQMRQLLQNLVSNALKFRRPELAPKVTVRGRDMDQFCRIIVEDNGIGFDEKYVDRIFGLFQRLHGRQEYEGTGMGLAICQKIAERHGGSITAKSTPGEGAKFIVTLPVEQYKEKLNSRIANHE